MKTNKRHYYQTSSFKMALLFAVMLSFSAFLIGYTLYDVSKQNFLRETEEILNNEIENITFNTLHNDINARIKYLSRKSSHIDSPLYYYTDGNGKYLTGNFTPPPLDKTYDIKEGIVGITIKINGKDSNLAGKIYTFEDGSKILVSKNINTAIESHRKLRFFSIITFFFIIIVVLISFFLSTFVVSRINKISNTAKSIINLGDLSKRIEIDSNWDDMSYLSSTLNQMLSRTENLMNGIKNVTNNIAHDLRTPLARLRNNIESIDYKNIDQDIIKSLTNECDNIISIFNSLLKINKVEKGEKLASDEKVELNKLVKDVIELYAPIAENKNITIVTLQGDNCVINADRNLIFQLTANLIDNSIKFSNDGGQIQINLSKIDNKVKFEISDNGIGVNEKDLNNIFDLFYRSQKSRSTPGNGLGLSLVKAIAEFHSAKILLENNNPGLKIIILFNI